MARAMCERLELDAETRQDVEFLVGRAPADVARGVPPRQRGSGRRAAIRRARRHRGAAEDAVPDDARRHRGRGPGHPDAVEGGAALAAVRRHLQPVDARLRRRGDRARAGGRRCAAGDAPRRHRRAGAGAVSRGVSAALSRHRRQPRTSTSTRGSPGTSGTDEVHLFLEPKGDVWELAVVTRDKPLLFSNICGTLSCFGMDILRGSAMTSPSGVVLDIFQFSDDEGFVQAEPRRAGATRVAAPGRGGRPPGRHGAPACGRRAGRSTGAGRRASTPVVYFDNAHSHSYTMLEIVAQDALGLLHRISRVISQHGCDVDLVLISTEGTKAIDVFHLTTAAAKLAPGGPAGAQAGSRTHAGGRMMMLIKAIVRPNKVDDIKGMLDELACRA